MPTTVTSSIGTSSRDYSTLQAWEDACPANLVTSDQIWRGECYNDSQFTGTLNISGVTTDATRYIELTTATGQSFQDDAGVRSLPLRYDQSKGVGVSTTTAFTAAIESSVDYTRISKLQITSSGTHANALYFRAQNGVAENCIIYGSTSLTNNVQLGLSATLKNSVIYGVAETGVTFESNNAQLLGCTLVKPGAAGTASALNAFTHTSGNIVANCAIFNYNTTVNVAGRFSNLDYCVTDLASPGVASETGSLFSKTFSSQFENVTSTGAADWRVKAGADLLGAGLPSYTGMLAADITGLTRANPSTIGAWEASASVTLAQEGAQFYNDDGSESGATSAAAQDANLTAPLNVNKILRAIIDATGDPASGSYTIRYKKNGSGGYVDVPVGSSSSVTTSPAQPTSGTPTTIGTASGTWALNRATASTGDMVVFAVAWDDSVTVASVTAPSGPNGESAVSIAGPIASASTEMRVQAWYYIATGTWSAGTVTFTPAASETCRAVSFAIPAAEFNASDPIGFANTRASAGTAESTVNSPTGTAEADDGDGRLFLAYGSDADAITAPASGTTTINNATGGGVGLCVVSRDTLVSNSESIAAIAATIASDSWASLCFVVKPKIVVTTNDFFISPSANIAGSGVATTARLTAPSGKTTGDFQAALLLDDANAQTWNPAADVYGEPGWCLQGQSPMVNGDFVDLHVYKDGSALDSYTVTPRWTFGSAATLTVGTGSYSLTGQSVSLLNNRALAVGAGAYSLTGNAVALSRGKVIAVGTGSYALSGQSVGLQQGHNLLVGAGSYSLSGQGVTLTKSSSFSLTVGAGAYSLSGQSVSLLDNRLLAVGAGAYSLSGQAVSLLDNRRLAVGAGSYALTGQAVTLAASTTPAAHPVSVSDLLKPRVGDDLARRGFLVRPRIKVVPPVTAANVSLIVGTGSYTLSGQSIGLLDNRRLGVGTGAYSLSGQNVGLASGRAISVGTGNYATTGNAVGLLDNRALVAGTGAYSLSGQNVSLLRSLRLAPEAGAYVLAGQDVALTQTAANTLLVGTGAYTLGGQDVDLIYTPLTGGPVPPHGSPAWHGVTFDRRKEDDEEDDKPEPPPVQEAFEQIPETAPKESIAARFLNSAGKRAKAQRRPIESQHVDWKALKKQPKAVESIITLWEQSVDAEMQAILDDDDEFIMMEL